MLDRERVYAFVMENRMGYHFLSEEMNYHYGHICRMLRGRSPIKGKSERLLVKALAKWRGTDEDEVRTHFDINNPWEANSFK